jgi:hypothetical protein
MTERSDIHHSSFVNRPSSIPALPGCGFKVAFSSLDCIWAAHLREKRQLRQG